MQYFRALALVSTGVVSSFTGPGVLAADRYTFPPVVESISVDEQENRFNAFQNWKKSTNQRLSKLERTVSNKILMDLFKQIDQLTQEIGQLRGRVEEQAHRIKHLQDKQKKIYMVQDQRLTELENRAATPAPPAATAIPVNPDDGTTEPAQQATAAAASPAAGSDFSNAPINREKELSTPEEKQAYQNALALVLDAQYEQAISTLQGFTKKYPNSAYNDNAQYWLGEANYATERYATALQAFTRLIKKYPRSNKIPDSILKIGFCYYELKQWEQAKKYLQYLIKTYPNHSTVSLAKKRLQLLKSEGY